MTDPLDGAPTTATPTPPNTATGHGGVSLTREVSATAKRRKVRKGTRSCWECKRRKTRCIFASSQDATCIGCQRRRTSCVSQEMPEDLSPARIGNRHLGERISRVEDMVKSILASNDGGTRSRIEGEPRHDEHSDSDALRARSNDSAASSIYAAPTPLESLGEAAPNSLLLTPDSHVDPGQTETGTVLRHLLAAFPSQEEAKILLRASSRSSLYTELVNTQPHSKLTRETLAVPHAIPELPGPNTHPVILAKLMLTFSITLQSPSGEKVVGLSEPPSVLMRRLITAATTWVTTREEMHGTIESLICIILEGVFEVNCGNLRRAWVVYRRAMTVAQLMGLHRSPMPPLKRIDPNVDADPKFMWFRIVYMDRYLSLLLGLPQGTYDKSIEAVQDEPPLGRFERQLTVIASRILERNESAFAVNEITATQSIDSELLRASKNMPAIFWRAANFHNLTPGSPDTLLETVRLAAQVYYYGLLIQLHLPYMMRVGHTTEHEYSKITCVNASREIMARFIAHRSFNPMSSCSRPVDFFALLAAMTLLLAHLDTHHHRGAMNSLAHQRLSDRAVLDQALERMDVISSVNKDVMTGESAKLIRRLLDMEADAAEGGNYTAGSVTRDDGVWEDKEEGQGLRLQIPYLGVIKIARQGPISREPFKEPLDYLNGVDQGSTFMGDLLAASEPSVAGDEPSMLQLQYPDPGHDDIALQPVVGSPTMAASVDEWPFQGVDMAFFDSLMRGTSSEDGGRLGGRR